MPRFQNDYRASVGVKAVFLAVLAMTFASAPGKTAFASTDSSWSSDDPSWSNSDSSDSNSNSNYSPARRRTANSSVASNNGYTNNNVSPFSPGSSNLALEMGQVFLMGNLSNNVSDSIGLGVHYTYGVSDLFAFDSSAGYSSHSNGALSMMNFQAGLRTNLAWYDKVIPYMSLGLGFYKPSYDLAALGVSSDPNASLSPILFGIHMGPGVDLEVTKQLFFGASLTFNDVFGSTQTTSTGQAFNVGGTYTTFFLHAGVTF